MRSAAGKCCCRAGPWHTTAFAPRGSAADLSCVAFGATTGSASFSRSGGEAPRRLRRAGLSIKRSARRREKRRCAKQKKRVTPRVPRWLCIGTSCRACAAGSHSTDCCLAQTICCRPACSRHEGRPPACHAEALSQARDNLIRPSRNVNAPLRLSTFSSSLASPLPSPCFKPWDKDKPQDPASYHAMLLY